MRVTVVGASGRVGGALLRSLSRRYEVTGVARRADETATSLAERSVEQADIAINAAGLAHVEHVNAEVEARLQRANVELPAALAEAALERHVSMVHISSVKAVDEVSSTPYARSKRQGDLVLQDEWAPRFAAGGIRIVIMRPLAMLFPPIHAGKVARLEFIRHVPSWLTPPIPLPVLAPGAFIHAVDEVIAEIAGGERPAGLSWRDFGRSDWGSLRDVQRAFSQMGG